MFSKLFSKSSKTASAANRSMTVENLEGRTMMSAAPAALHADAPRHEAATVVSLKHHETKVVTRAAESAPAGRTTGAKSSDFVVPGATVAEPLVTANGLHEVNYGNYPLFAAGGPSMNDVSQGEAGDCYYLAAIAAEAAKDPQRIEQLCRARGDGTFDVYFYNNGWVDEHVDGQLPVNQYGQLEYAQLGQGNSTWVAIMEKAFCFFRASQMNQTPGYNVIDGGIFGDAEGFKDMGLGTLEVSGSAFSSGAQLCNYLAQELNTYNYDVVLSTNGNNSPLIGAHAYSVVGAELYQGTDWVEVRNPWGTNTPGGQPYQWVTANSLLGQLSQIAISMI